MPIRFPLLVLMAAIGVLGLGLGGIRDGSATADRLAFSATLLGLLVGLLGALVRRGSGAWVGFALFGWAYFLMTNVPAIHETLGERLLIKQPLEDLVERMNDIPPEPPEPPFQQANGLGKMVDGQVVPMSPEEIQVQHDYLKRSRERWSRYNQISGRIDRSRQVGHSTLTLLFAALGAILGRALADRSTPPGASTGAEPPNPAG